MFQTVDPWIELDDHEVDAVPEKEMRKGAFIFFLVIEII